MLFHAIGLLYSFCIAAFFSSGITLAPLTVAWGSFWTYLTFVLCMIPGYIAAWFTILIIFGLLALLGFGAALGTAASMDEFSKKNRW